MFILASAPRCGRAPSFGDGREISGPSCSGGTGEGGRRRRGVGDFGEAFGAVAVDSAGGADAVGAEEGGEARDGRREAVG